MKMSIQAKNSKLIYIGLCFVIFGIIYFPILLNNKMYMYIDIGADTYCSYWPSIAYVKELLKDIKLWDMTLGLGNSTVSYISYFLMDPFNIPCYFFDEYHMTIGIFLGLICKNTVLAYYAYRYTGKKHFNGLSRIIASLAIVFCGWFVGWGQHYNFATAFVYFIIVLYYFEFWIQDGLFIRLVVSISLLAMNSPYYCYMVLLFLASYYICYQFQNLKKLYIKDILFHGIKTLGLVFWGLGISAILFIPFISDMTLSPRVDGSVSLSFKLGNLNEYISIFLRLFSNSILGNNNNFAGYGNFYECPFMYVGIIFMFCLILFLKERKRQYILPILLISFSILFLNISSVLFNGFSTKGFRWTFIFVPVFALVIGRMIDQLSRKENRNIIFATAFFSTIVLVLYAIWYEKIYSFNRVVISCVVFAIIILWIYFLISIFVKDSNKKGLFILVVFSAELAVNGYVCVNRGGLISNDAKKNMAYFDDTNEVIDYLYNRDDSFFRISKTYALIDLNDNQIQHYYGEKIYSSILSEEMWDMISFFDLRIPESNYFYGFEDKQALRNISCGKYRLSKSDNNYYGYKKVAQIGEVFVYENINNCEFGSVYNNYILRSEAERLNSLEVQDLLYETVILEDEEVEDLCLDINHISENEAKNMTTSSIDAVINKKVDEKNISVQIKPNTSSIYVIFNGEEASGTITFYTDDGIVLNENAISFNNISGQKYYYIDLIGITSINIAIEGGTISNVCVKEIDGYGLNGKASDRNAKSAETISFSDTYIKLKTVCTEESLLMLPVMYNDNWKVYIDGVESNIYHANCGYMSVVVPERECIIELRYVSNEFYIGAVISIFSISSICLIGAKRFVRKKYNVE